MRADTVVTDTHSQTRAMPKALSEKSDLEDGKDGTSWKDKEGRRVTRGGLRIESTRGDRGGKGGRGRADVEMEELEEWKSTVGRGGDRRNTYPGSTERGAQPPSALYHEQQREIEREGGRDRVE
ncbi:Uncharacterized protein DBV15_06733 [Temnothorax longispinosus]|uniref:Uncharacterized protein n=1 Tax=Temnothorax longispinosus TaxID=300112 RepID=A0A4S2JRB5_9HYME|nr:Uncharacterized protein DBV15_06733 [Temnothorax longispinosus]